MSGSADTYECARCGTIFPKTANHTELVRRDFVEVPQPAQVERLCEACWSAYLADFLDQPRDPPSDRAASDP